MTDTFERSCDHWSEARRAEMDDFYSLATVDYDHLARSRDWTAWFESLQHQAGDRPLRLLDVACGSGKFPRALLKSTHLGRSNIQPVHYDLLDPSAFSIDEARKQLSTPFMGNRGFECTLQDFDGNGYDVVWATHALYAVPPDELKTALIRFLEALSGEGFIAHSSSEGHYIEFYRLFLESMRDGKGTPYTSAEQIEACLRELGARVEATTIRYENGVPVSDTATVEGFLQRCVFDDSVTLSQMLEHRELAAYLEPCRTERGWRFPQ
ncbi:MAG: class I SAM-dependent methyltransferase, partial [Myxococcota bacterium]